MKKTTRPAKRRKGNRPDIAVRGFGGAEKEISGGIPTHRQMAVLYPFRQNADGGAGNGRGRPRRAERGQSPEIVG